MMAGTLAAPILVEPTTYFARFSRRWIGPALRVWGRLSTRWLRGRGIGGACRLAAASMGTSGKLTFRLGRGGLLEIDTADRYWIGPLLMDREYEIEVDHFLQRYLTADDGFIDCGANIGLWSAVAAQVIPDPSRVVAVEASEHTAAKLRRNALLNDNRFTVIQRAVGSRSGDVVAFYSSVRDHASSTAVEEFSPADSALEFAETVALVDLVAGMTVVNPESVVFVKLDIEGNELSAIRSLPSGLEHVVILYEDHGRDAAHEATVGVLESGFSVAYLADDGTLELISLETIPRLTALKPNPNRGYNLVAFAPGSRAKRRLFVGN